ncbi:MAG: hypothetical protein M3N47_02605 [Chloroflexota bacterium]|nr:hypothetical protein [Chloroflexota bacterium]
MRTASQGPPVQYVRTETSARLCRSLIVAMATVGATVSLIGRNPEAVALLTGAVLLVVGSWNRMRRRPVVLDVISGAQPLPPGRIIRSTPTTWVVELGTVPAALALYGAVVLACEVVARFGEVAAGALSGAVLALGYARLVTLCHLRRWERERELRLLHEPSGGLWSSHKFYFTEAIRPRR